MCHVLFSELSPSHLSHDQMSRSKSESATGEVIDEDDEDVDYGNYFYMFHNIIICYHCFCDEIKT